MSINAINGISLYEYYYTINQEDKKKKSSPLADEMREYGLKPTDDEALNASMLVAAKRASQNNAQEEETQDYSDRPWADLMYQLDIDFNPDPAQDIEDIKEEVAKLAQGFDDEELRQDVLDLENYAQSLYISYQQNNLNRLSGYETLSSQLNNISIINRANLI